MSKQPFTVNFTVHAHDVTERDIILNSLLTISSCSEPKDLEKLAKAVAKNPSLIKKAVKFLGS